MHGEQGVPQALVEKFFASRLPVGRETLGRDELTELHLRCREDVQILYPAIRDQVLAEVGGALVGEIDARLAILDAANDQPKPDMYKANRAGHEAQALRAFRSFALATLSPSEDMTEAMKRLGSANVEMTDDLLAEVSEHAKAKGWEGSGAPLPEAESKQLGDELSRCRESRDQTLDVVEKFKHALERIATETSVHDMAGEYEVERKLDGAGCRAIADEALEWFEERGAEANRSLFAPPVLSAVPAQPLPEAARCAEAVKVLTRFMCCKAGEQYVEKELLRPFGFTLDAGPVVRQNNILREDTNYAEIILRELADDVDSGRGGYTRISRRISGLADYLKRKLAELPPLPEGEKCERRGDDDPLYAALKPFAQFASGQDPFEPRPAVECGEAGARWTHFGVGLSRDRIVDWFGPSDFLAAQQAFASLHETGSADTVAKDVYDRVCAEVMELSEKLELLERGTGKKPLPEAPRCSCLRVGDPAYRRAYSLVHDESCPLHASKLETRHLTEPPADKPTKEEE